MRLLPSLEFLLNTSYTTDGIRWCACSSYASAWCLCVAAGVVSPGGGRGAGALRFVLIHSEATPILLRNIHVLMLMVCILSQCVLLQDR